MPLDSIAQINISLSAQPAARPTFSVALFMGDFTPAQDALFGAALTAEISALNFLNELAALGFSSGNALFDSVQTHFTQAQVPVRCIIARRQDTQAQVNTYLVTGATDGTYTVTIGGVDFSFVAVGSTADLIRDGLVAAINGGAEPVTAAPGGAGTLTVTADQAGIPFTSATSSTGDPITDTPTTPSIGINDDLTDFNNERIDWYGVLEVDRDDEEQELLADSIEAFPRDLLGIELTNDANAQGGDAPLDLGAKLRDKNIFRTGVWWNANEQEYVDAAIVGKMFAFDPGDATWAAQTLVGVVGISAAGLTPALTSETRLVAKNYSWLEQFTAAQFSMTSHTGTVANGQFYDVIRGRDAVAAEMQLRLVEALRDNPKLPYTDEGAAVLGSVIDAVLLEFAEPDAGLVVGSTIVVRVPPITAQSPVDKANRHFANITWSATLQGAIHTLEVNGALVP